VEVIFIAMQWETDGEKLIYDLGKKFQHVFKFDA
jgi:hypothetical protein